MELQQTDPMPSRLHHLLYRIVFNLPDPFRGFWMAWLIALVFPDAGLRRLAWLALGSIKADIENMDREWAEHGAEASASLINR